MAQTSLSTLKTFLVSSEEVQALKDGTVTPAAHGLEFIELSPAPVGMRRMARGVEFDVSEMALSTYICARAYGIPIIGLPVFFLRRFHHSMVLYNTKSGIKAPGDLRGKRFGSRSYTFTPAVWVRGILDMEFGVGTHEMVCVRSGDEHVQEYEYPSNVELAPEGKDTETLLAEGAIDAAVVFGKVDPPDVKPLFPDPQSAAIASFKNTGVYPSDHMVVLKEETLRSEPSLAQELFTAFKASRDLYLAKVQGGGELSPESHAMLERKAIVGGDAMPYGVPKNRRMLEAIVQFCVDQKVARKPMEVDDLFAPDTLDLE